VLHLLYTYAVTPGQPEATTKARECLRDALSCYNKALGDEKARCCMRDGDLPFWLPVCLHANHPLLIGCKPQTETHSGRCNPTTLGALHETVNQLDPEFAVS